MSGGSRGRRGWATGVSRRSDFGAGLSFGAEGLFSINEDLGNSSAGGGRRVERGSYPNRQGGFGFAAVWLGKKVVVGGAVSVHSLPFFQKFPAGHLDRFETRKVVFECPGALKNTEQAFLKGVEFEIMWLRNKKDYYGSIHREDDSRLAMMQERYDNSIKSMNLAQ